MKQRTRIATTIAGLSLLAPALQVAAQAAAKPLRFLVGAPAGGSNDIFARAIGQRMSESIGQPVVVDNRPGASQMIAADLAAKALADGNTLYMTSTTYTTGAALMAKLPFDPLNDLTGITMVARGPSWLVRPGAAKTDTAHVAYSTARLLLPSPLGSSDVAKFCSVLYAEKMTAKQTATATTLKRPRVQHRAARRARVMDFAA